MGKVLIVVGIVVLAIGLLVQLGIPLGRLPGDIKIERGSATFYSPLVTGIVISIILTVLLNILIRR